MKISPLLRGFLPLGLLLQISTPGFAAQCKIQRLETPVIMDGVHPIITAQINGKDARFTLNSGSWWSSMSSTAAQAYQLRLDPKFTQDQIGSAGRSTMNVATVDTFTVFNTIFRKIDFLVGGDASGSSTAGRIGLNILRMADVEYDLAHGSVNFLQTHNCQNARLVYWAKPGDTYSLMSIERVTHDNPNTVGTAYLNGKRLRVWFDTGSTTSWVGLSAAARAGFKPGDPGVEEFNAGTSSNPRRAWIATFPSFKMGDEEIRNARLRFTDLGQFDMVVGADFFLSHHVLVANSQSNLYFTYNGGPVFNDARALEMEKARGLGGPQY